MERIAEFEKVSFKQFLKDCNSFGELPFSEEELCMYWNELSLPTRATIGSAGYDFHIPFPFWFPANTRITIPSGVRCKIEPGWLLSAYPKSGLGFKYGTALANTVGIIDMDYYFSSNEGHIMFKVFSNTAFSLNSGDKFIQGIFLSYGITKSDAAYGSRNGGFGSTGA